MFFTSRRTLPEGLTVYSLTDLGSFFGALPLLAAVFSLLLLALLLGARAFRLSKDPQKGRKALYMHGAVGAALLLGIALLLYLADLPSSLMPAENFFDFGHYAKEFSRIFSALREFSAAGSDIAASALSQAQVMLWVSLGILILGTAVSTGVLLFGNIHKKGQMKK